MWTGQSSWVRKGNLTGRRTPEKKPQLSKSEDVGLNGIWLETGHLHVTVDATWQTLYQYGVVPMGRGGQVGVTPDSMPWRGPAYMTGHWLSHLQIWNTKTNSRTHPAGLPWSCQTEKGSQVEVIWLVESRCGELAETSVTPCCSWTMPEKKQSKHWTQKKKKKQWQALISKENQ